ncbi:HK97 family phage prohead protease [Bradyrhizobium sp. GCM10028915]|uniref:HK97 family phage prohead protease n=1 Tax=Bradyrhizobium sp. GCM10028915 TaxID=3273385 RepID=UPI003609D235
MNHLIGIDTSVHDRMVRKYARYFREAPSSACDVDEPRLCVEGLAVLTEEPIATKTGEILVFEKGAFDGHFASGARTEVWLAHDPTQVVCSTVSGLEFAETDEGLAFRFPLDNKRYADDIKRKVESGRQACVSVGITRTKERTETVGSHKVIFIESAELRECSLVAAGACDQAFARLIDANHSPSLKESVKTTPFKIDSGLHNIKTQREKNTSRIESLRGRLDALDGRAETFSAGTGPDIGRPATKCPTLEESNRAQTEETERLQRQARASLFH